MDRQPCFGKRNKIRSNSKGYQWRLAENGVAFCAPVPGAGTALPSPPAGVFVVLVGLINVRMNGTVQSFRSGDRIKIDAGTIHSMWNGGSEEAIVNWKVTPAMNTE